jgi:outer membrane protein TolC
MKIKLPFIVFLTLLSPGILQSQKILSLKECYDLAMIKSSLAGEADAWSNISRLNDENLKKGWLPTLDANANAGYNSDVVDFSKTLGAIPGMSKVLTPMPHDQYKVTLDVNQVIYDGGAIKSGRAIEKADQGINRKQTESDMYKLREQINAYYFNVMLLNRQKELLTNYRDLIKKRISSMESAMKNGAILRSDVDVLASEKVKIEQQLTENELRRNSLLKNLSDLTGSNIDNTVEFVLPHQEEQLKTELMRPELQLYDLRKEKLSAGLQMEQSKRMPKAFGFATLGYGKPPGQDFFTDSFGPYYIVGAGIKWNIFDWNRVKNTKEAIMIQQGIIENRKKDLTDNLKRLLEAKSAEISSLEALMGSDTELIAIRKRITASSESQYQNGVITATEYLNQMNSEQQALINFEIHKINLALARVEYLNISGNDIH